MCPPELAFFVVVLLDEHLVETKWFFKFYNFYGIGDFRYMSFGWHQSITSEVVILWIFSQAVLWCRPNEIFGISTRSQNWWFSWICCLVSTRVTLLPPNCSLYSHLLKQIFKKWQRMFLGFSYFCSTVVWKSTQSHHFWSIFFGMLPNALICQMSLRKHFPGWGQKSFKTILWKPPGPSFRAGARNASKPSSGNLLGSLSGLGPEIL